MNKKAFWIGAASLLGAGLIAAATKARKDFNRLVVNVSKVSNPDLGITQSGQAIIAANLRIKIFNPFDLGLTVRPTKIDIVQSGTVIGKVTNLPEIRIPAGATVESSDMQIQILPSYFSFSKGLDGLQLQISTLVNGVPISFTKSILK